MALDVVATSPQAAHEAVTEAWRVSKELTQAGKPVRITATEDENDRSLEANRFYWSDAFLGAISEQVRTPDRWTKDAWHNLFRRQFLGYSVTKEMVAGKKKPVVIRRLRSTRDLKVKEFATYLEQITAYAVTELHVEFPA